ncbi:ABC transporter [Vibrio alginolyticus]|uniref:ATP-binding cassette domain-containing protein n=1 Tax=Vibrio TaxID=662 RepID=UPI00063D88B5|nr:MULTISPECIES: ABC transporter ATP-binding protein [Vibrio]EIJ2377458.1 ABC transporter ATP-binding protein [Vibrio alginolyticus]EKA3118105.1 ABC transporter ATP-binding protein [Vibrio alginolyticus]EMB9222535.1 ABC transporter ATP-binding protein [Vibrio alginolyticus]KLI73476.1 ABC transporter [Vibrio alginolyticus]MBS9945952.1 ABC transporter ATP-binding protein [Vibrio alginolyticus]
MISKISQHYVTPSLMPALKPSIKKLALGTFCEVLAAVAKVGALLCLINLIDRFANQWIYGAIGLWAASALASSVGSWLVHEAESQFSTRLRRQVAQHLTRLPSKTISQYGDNQLRRIVSEDINTLHHMVAHLPSELVTFIVVPATSIFIMLNLTGPVAMLTLLPGLIASLYYLLFLPRFAAKHGTERMTIMGDIVTAVNDYTRGIRVNRIYGTQAGALDSYNDATRRFTHGIVKWVGSVALPAAIATALLQAVSTFAIAYTIGYELSPVAMASLFFFGLAVVSPALKLGHGLDYVNAGKNAAKNISDFLQQPQIESGSLSAGEKPLSLQASNIVVANGTVNIIDNFSHNFPRGSFTAIMGPSGAGKSTLLRLLAGQETPLSGFVTLGGHQLSKLSEISRYSAIRYVPQDIGVLKTTIRQNLKLSTPSSSDDELNQALQQAQLKIDLNSDASVLSGGEQQRVAIANTFLTQANVLLLDEPTSALDKNTAFTVIRNLAKFAKAQDKILIIITHDSELAKLADTTLMLNRKAQRQDEEV